jgi:DNA-binding PadR family transcriptional regulator
MHGHHHHGGGAWRHFEAMGRRGFRGFQNFGGFGDWGSFGDNFRIGKMLASGDLRLVALYLIEQQPRHGYDLIKAIEEKSQGFYSPSPGVVYPALTYLEEAGYVTSAAEGNKKLYTITDEGRAHLNSNREAIQATLGFLEKAGEKVNEWREKSEQAENFRRQAETFRDTQHHHGGRPDRDIPDVLPEVNEARRELKAAIADAIGQGEDAQRRLADILRRAAADLRRPDGDVDL